MSSAGVARSDIHAMSVRQMTMSWEAPGAASALLQTRLAVARLVPYPAPDLHRLLRARRRQKNSVGRHGLLSVFMFILTQHTELLHMTLARIASWLWITLLVTNYSLVSLLVTLETCAIHALWVQFRSVAGWPRPKSAASTHWGGKTGG